MPATNGFHYVYVLLRRRGNLTRTQPHRRWSDRDGPRASSAPSRNNSKRWLALTQIVSAGKARAVLKARRNMATV
jgi:hypothetical protein